MRFIRPAGASGFRSASRAPATAPFSGAHRETAAPPVAYHSTNAIDGTNGGELPMRDTAPAVLTGLVLGWFAKDAWPLVEPILAAFGFT